MANFSKLLSFFVGTVLLLPVSHAQAAPTLVQVPANGRTVTVNVPAGQDPNTQYILFYSSRGNTSVPLVAEVTGPAGITGQIQYKKLSGAVRTAAANTKRWITMNLTNALRIRGGGQGAHYQTSEARTCTQEQLEMIRQLIPIVPAWEGLTAEEICANGSGGEEVPLPNNPGTEDPGNPTPNLGDGATVRTAGVIYKDTCAKLKKYIVRATLDLSRVDPTLRAQGFSFQVSFDENTFTRSMAATLKPSSDGRFRGQPLILMSTTGRYYPIGEQLYLMKWSGDRLLKTQQIKVEDYVSYRGYQLTRSLVGKYLTGGKGVFVLINSRNYNAYSICLNLTRSRQSVNGYPN